MVIYKTTNLINGKIYIGKDVINNKNYLGSGLLIKKSIKKYGRTNFKKEILETCSTLEELSSREKYWILEFKSTDRKIGYNITDGGSGGVTWWNTPKQKENYHKLQLGSLKFNRSEEGRKFLSENSKRMWKNPNHKKLISDKLKGREITWNDKISNSIKEWHKSNPISKETRKLISEKNRIKMTGKDFKPISDEIKNKIVEFYNECGPKTISLKLKKQNINVSSYLITKILKKLGVYQKWKKGLKK